MKPKLTFAINSHGLRDYKRCPKLYEFRHVKFYQEEFPWFSRGILWAKCMRILFYRLRKNQAPQNILRLLNRILLKRLRNPAKPYSIYNIVRNPTKADEMIAMFIGRLHAFVEIMKDDFQNYIIEGIEIGASKILIDEPDLFVVYEGRIDRLLRSKRNDKLFVADDKTYEKQVEIYPYNDQMLGYCWLTGARSVLYYYVGFTSQPSETAIYKKAYHFLESDIERWLAETRYFVRNLAENLRQQSFYRSGLCRDEYRLCSYSHACEETPIFSDTLIQVSHKKKEYRSW